MTTFEDFVRTCLDHGHTQIKLVPQVDIVGCVTFSATGQRGHSSCADFNGMVSTNHMIDMDLAKGEPPVENEPLSF